MADQLNVKREEVMEMETRMSGGDVLLDPAPSDDGEQAFGPIAYLADAAHEPTAMIESHQRDVLSSDGIATALANLDERSRRIVEERWLKVNDDGSGGMTLHDLAAEYGVSAERIRQIEVGGDEEDEEKPGRIRLIIQGLPEGAQPSPVARLF
jgi:RNA polymerase sigma-32 factor